MATAVPPHLGGYVQGGDEATWFPELWSWLVTQQGVGSVIDVGCGDGQALRYFAERACVVAGIEGVRQPQPYIWQHDYTTGVAPQLAAGSHNGEPFAFPLQDFRGSDVPPVTRFDLAWCCEFVEHVEERYMPNFLLTFREQVKPEGLVLMTHASPGQAGHHHVNCRTPDYWRGALAAYAFQYDDELTSVTRALASANRSPWNHYTRSGMAFRRV